MEYCKITKFYQLSRAWYGLEQLKRTDYIDEIMLMDESSHELGIRWYLACGELLMRVESFYDGLPLIPDLLGILSEYKEEDPSPEVLVNWLKSKGIKDCTRINP